MALSLPPTPVRGATKAGSCGSSRSGHLPETEPDGSGGRQVGRGAFQSRFMQGSGEVVLEQRPDTAVYSWGQAFWPKEEVVRRPCGESAQGEQGHLADTTSLPALGLGPGAGLGAAEEEARRGLASQCVKFTEPRALAWLCGLGYVRPPGTSASGPAAGVCLLGDGGRVGCRMRTAPRSPLLPADCGLHLPSLYQVWGVCLPPQHG